MAEADQQKLQNAAEQMMERLDKNVLKAMQRDAYLCSAECLSSSNSHGSNSQFTQQCIQRCQIGIQQASNVVQQEMSGLQNRLQRNVMACQDQANDRTSANMSQKEMDKLQTSFEKCASGVIGSHISLLGSTEKKLAASLKELGKK